jgi:hypothetical protein
MTKEQKTANNVFFGMILFSMKDGAYYLWPDEKEKYTKVDNKLKPNTPYGFQCLKKITTKEWFEKNVIEP